MSIFGCFIFGVYFVIVCSIFMDFFLSHNSGS